MSKDLHHERGEPVVPHGAVTEKSCSVSHTPGPWKAIHEPVCDYSDWTDNGGYRIDADGVEQLAFVWALNHRIPPNGPQESGPLFGAIQAGANARLIATAPEMYDVIYDLWAYAADAPDIHLRSLAERARDALAKIKTTGA